jgi:hypothetical protein
MGFRAHILRHVKFDELDDDDREELKKRLQEHKKELQTAMKAVDRGLKALRKKKK